MATAKLYTFTHNGTSCTTTIKQLSRITGISYGTLRRRIVDKKWPIKQACTVPVNARGTGFYCRRGHLYDPYDMFGEPSFYKNNRGHRVCKTCIRVKTLIRETDAWYDRIGTPYNKTLAEAEAWEEKYSIGLALGKYDDTPLQQREDELLIARERVRVLKEAANASAQTQE